jgi:hypothetical protein
LASYRLIDDNPCSRITLKHFRIQSSSKWNTNAVGV